MNRKRVILYTAFACYQTGVFVFTLWLDTTNLDDLFGLLKYIPWFKYLGFLGLAFLITDIVWNWIDRRAQNKKQDELDKESTDLKARIFDFQEEAKKAASKQV